MIFLNIKDKQFVLFRIKKLLEYFNRKKKVLRDIEEKKKIINQITFYKQIQQKLQQCQGDVEYSLFTNDNDIEIFYISMILGMRGHYRTLKSLCEIGFTEDEKLHADLQRLLRRVLELDPTLYDYYYDIYSRYVHIVKLSTSVSNEMEQMSVCHGRVTDELYKVWTENIYSSLALLSDYESWRPENLFALEKISPHCCQGRGHCYCHVDNIEEILYRLICANVFFNEYLHVHTPPHGYWWGKSSSSFP